MSEGGEAQDACASRAKPKREARVCESGRRLTRRGGLFQIVSRRPHRRARPRAIEAADNGTADQGDAMLRPLTRTEPAVE